ncbi:MAG: N-acetylmannosamine-6-phosphate 2-epimerase [Candidatus Velthaea sp.]
MSVLERLRGGLIVSVQAEADSLLNTPQTIALLARVAEANGAAGVRIEGAARIAAVRTAVDIPVIGIVKRAYEGFGPYITVTEREIGEAAGAGADIIAFDATGRQRPTGLDVAALCAAVRTAGALPMADCATLADGRVAAAGGAAIVASTLCGYTDETRGTPLPALDLVRALSALGAFTICEGGVGTPGQVKDALATGADAVVVGTAITNIDVLVRRFAAQTSKTT